MTNKRIVLCFLIITTIVLSSCAQYKINNDEYWNSITSEVEQNQYDRQIEKACKYMDIEVKKIIEDASESQYSKNKRILIFKNEGTVASQYLNYITGQLRDEYDLIEKIGTLTYIPLGRRYVIVEHAFLEEQIARKLIIIFEIDDNDEIIEPYHLYVFDSKVKLLYRGEGAPKAAAYEVDSYEYGRQPDIIKEK